jgi:uncharacterized membrane protein
MAMDEFLVTLTEFVVPLINIVALVTVVAGTIECVVRVIGVSVAGTSRHALRSVWLQYAGWLVAALTFQLGADILETAIAPSWEDIGRLAAIAVIRTFLEFFLGRDVTEIRERQHERAKAAAD